LRHRLLSSGLTPLEFWVQARAGIQKIKGMKHYWVDVRQPLDDRWSSAGSAMPGQEQWRACTYRYGVLAFDEVEAAKAALHWQTQTAPLPASVTAVTLDGGLYTDAPGVTQRSFVKPVE
jgi:hypothetical protein